MISGLREISRDTQMERAARAATGLGELGVGTGDAIGILLRNDFAFSRRAMPRSVSAPTACRSTGTAKPRKLLMC